jgi:SLIT-ROBO Rho GTPase activating protein
VEEEATRKERESETLSNKQRVDRQETEQFYLAKFREYILNSNRISRLQAKYDHIRKCLGEHSCSNATATLPRPITNSRRRIGRTMLAGQPKLFGGSLEEYLELTQQDIPLVVKSCIRLINLYGLHHQGIFRVSGSQVRVVFVDTRMEPISIDDYCKLPTVGSSFFQRSCCCWLCKRLLLPFH